MKRGEIMNKHKNKKNVKLWVIIILVIIILAAAILSKVL